MKLNGGLVLLREILEELSPSEQNIARYILEHPQEIAVLNISELAERSSASPAGIVRLCRKLRMKGFHELKLRVTMDINTEQENERSIEIKKGVSAQDIIHTIIQKNRNAMSSLERILDVTAVEDAAHAILSARLTNIYGIGASGIAAIDLLQKLQRIGLSCFYGYDLDLQITSACSLTPRDVAVAIFYSGRTEGIIAALKEARRSGAKTVSITRFRRSPAVGLSDIVLFVPSIEPLIREGAMASRLAQLALIDILFSVIVFK